ncbi:hypothetical protein ACFSOV_16300 [Pedobacter petrophilus]|uniref:hypothetical protein n=1 Tax=Pedobacter petrophilus TaxID=1908241 RepID=UPI00363E47BC
MRITQLTYKIFVLSLMVFLASGNCEAISSIPVMARSFQSSSLRGGTTKQSISKERLLSLMKNQTPNDEVRSRTSFNKDWKFFLGDEPGARSPAFTDTKWRKLTLPHDWSIEGKFDQKILRNQRAEVYQQELVGTGKNLMHLQTLRTD